MILPFTPSFVCSFVHSSPKIHQLMFCFCIPPNFSQTFDILALFPAPSFMLIGVLLIPCVRSLMSLLVSEKEQGEWTWSLHPTQWLYEAQSCRTHICVCWKGHSHIPRAFRWHDHVVRVSLGNMAGTSVLLETTTEPFCNFAVCPRFIKFLYFCLNVVIAILRIPG